MQQDPIRHGDRWVWADGTTLPVVAGGQIDVDAMGGEETPAEAPETPAADVSAADAPETPPADAAPEAEDKFAHWPDDARTERQRLIDENAKYRQRWKPFEETFGGLHDDDQQFMLGFVNAFKAGDAAEISRYAPALRAYLDQLSPAERKQAEDALDAAAGGNASGVVDDFDPFNPEHIDKRIEERARKMLDERDQAAAQERAERERAEAVDRATQEIQTAAASLATKYDIPEWGDPTSGMYAALVSVAQRVQGETTLDARMAKAAEQLMEELERRGQAMLKAKTAGAGEAIAPHGGDEPSGRKAPRTLDDADAAAMERLAAFERGPTGG